MTGPRRLFVKLDCHAIFDLGRIHRLSSSEQWLLTSLVLGANFRVKSWAGTIAAISEVTGMSRNTVRDALDRLVQVGLVAILSPFGPNRVGCISLVCYDELVVGKHDANAQNCAVEPETNRAESRESAEPNRAEQRGNRAGTAQNCASTTTVSGDGAIPRRIDIDAAKAQGTIEANGHARKSKTGVVLVDRVSDQCGEFSGAADDDDLNRCYRCGQFDCVCDLR